jgi:lysozyme
MSYLFGLDLSHWNGNVDFQSVAASGISFCYIKATQNGSYVDPMLTTNCAGATAAGLPFGLYHLWKSSGDNITNFLKVYGEHPSQMPPALDLEPGALPLTEDGEAMGLEWLATVEKETKRKPLVYCSPSVAQFLTDPAWQGYPLWIAHYDVEVPTFAPWKQWTIWQHTSSGSVPGISGFVDLDRFAGDVSDLAALTGVTT